MPVLIGRPSLPRLVRSGQCSALDDNGKPCRRKAYIEDRFHGNPEWIEPVSWVRVNWCRKHAIEMAALAAQGGEAITDIPNRDWLAEIDDCYAHPDAADNLLRGLAIELNAELDDTKRRLGAAEGWRIAAIKLEPRLEFLKLGAEITPDDEAARAASEEP